MNWFQRHLNWTFILGLIGTWFVGFIALFIYGMLSETVFYPPIGAIHEIVGIILGWLFWIFIVSVRFTLAHWVLKHKSRSLWWIPILLVPFGEIAILVLHSKPSLGFKAN